MAKDRDLQKSIAREQLFLLNKINVKATEAKNAYRKRLAEIEAQKENFVPEYISGLQEKERTDLQAANQKLYSEFMTQLEKLENALSELDNSLDLVDPGLTTALDLIKNVGKDLGVENVLRINSQFSGNQPVLKVLQSAYKAAGLAYDGGLDKQIYNFSSSIKAIGQQAEGTFLRGDSINTIAGVICKLAKLEGYQDFETLPDVIGVDDAMRRGAGLS